MTEGRKVIRMGDHEIAIVESLPAPVVSADVFTEMWVWNGAIHVSFATLVKDGEAVAEARVQSRVRIPLPMAKDMMNAFKNILDVEMPGPERAN